MLLTEPKKNSNTKTVIITISTFEKDRRKEIYDVKE